MSAHNGNPEQKTQRLSRRPSFWGFLDRWTEPLPADFPYSSDKKPETLSRRSFFLILSALIVLAVLPRVVLAFRLEAVCDDAYYYISVADAWKQSDFKTALQYLNINVYPFILWGLHGLGLDWVVAGKIWGVAVSALTIPPLFGLIRGLYNVRVGAAACFLFAIHPELIEASIEPIRGPTFWFLFTLSLYASWRAANSNRWFWYPVVGICITLAIHTRAEGWILFVPLLLWPILLRRPDVSRKRVAIGLLSSAAIVPLFLAVVNLTLLQQEDEWEWGRLTHFRHFQEWLRSETSEENINISVLKPRPWTTSLPTKPPHEAAVVAPKPKHAVAKNRKAKPAAPPIQQVATPVPKPSPAASPPEIKSPFRDGRWYVYVRQISSKFHPVNLIFMLFAVCGWWRVMFRRDKIVMLLIFLGLMLAIWVRLSQIGDMNGRYFFSAFLVAIPFAAVGMLVFIRRMQELAGRLIANRRIFHAVPAVIVLALMTLHLVDFLTTHHRNRRAQVKLGVWINRELGPFDSVMVDRSATRVGYFSFGTMPTMSYYFSSSGDGVETRTPDLLILTRKLSRPEERVYIYQQVARMQLVEIDRRDIPDSGKEYFIFARRLPRSVSHPVTTANQSAGSVNRSRR